MVTPVLAGSLIKQAQILTENQHSQRRRWLVRAVKVLLLVAVVAAMVPFCSGFMPVGASP